MRDRDDEALDLDDGDERPRRRRRGRERDRAQPLRAVRTIAWAGLFVVTGGVGLALLSALAGARSAIQEAGAGAVFGAVAIVSYVLVRSVDEVLDGVERARERD